MHSLHLAHCRQLLARIVSTIHANTVSPFDAAGIRRLLDFLICVTFSTRPRPSTPPLAPAPHVAGTTPPTPLMPTAPADAPNAAIVGIAMTVVACSLFAAMDATTKFAGGVLPMLMVVWVRFAVQTLATSALLLPRQGWQVLRSQHPKFQFWRAFSGVMTSVFGFFCIQSMPLANFTATWSVVPLLIVVASALLFKEQVSPVRWLLLLVGLAAVMVIIRPEHSGQPLGWAALLPVGLLVCGTAYQILGSRLARLDGPHTTQMYTNLIPVLLLAPLIPFVWQTGTPWQIWGALVLIGLLGASGHLIMLMAFARTSPATVSPFLYSQIGFATLLGWLLYGQVPDLLSILGMLVVTLCGFANIWLVTRRR